MIWKAAALPKPCVHDITWWDPYPKERRRVQRYFERPRNLSSIALHKDLAESSILVEKAQFNKLRNLRLTCKDVYETTLFDSITPHDSVHHVFQRKPFKADFSIDRFVFYCGEIEQRFYIKLDRTFVEDGAIKKLSEHQMYKIGHLILLVEGAGKTDVGITQRLSVAFKDFVSIKTVLFLFNEKTELMMKSAAFTRVWEKKFGISGPKVSFATVENGLQQFGEEYVPHRFLAQEEKLDGPREANYGYALSKIGVEYDAWANRSSLWPEATKQ